MNLMVGPLLVILLFLIGVPSSQAEPATNENAAAFLANNIGRLSEFERLWDRLGLSPTSIADVTRQTLLAVTNEGWNSWTEFDSLSDNDEQATLYTNNTRWREHLRQLLYFHIVVTDALTVDQIFDGSRESLDTFAQFSMSIDQFEERLGDVVPVAAIVDPDNLVPSADDSVQTMIHLLDQVIVPPFLAVNLIDRLLMNKDEDLSTVFAYTTMANLALYAGLDEQLNELSEEGLTLLVPPNRRFNRADIDVAALLTEEMRNYTRDFVLAHMIRGNYDTTRITTEINTNHSDTSSLLVQSELGTSLWITTTGGRLRFQSREVLTTNQVARNGIFHVLDLPLFPPYISDVVEFTALSFSPESDYYTFDCSKFFKETLLKSVDIANMFNTTLTMFCPNRKAFEFFNKPTYNRLLEPIWNRHATEFLLNQIMSPALSMEQLMERVPTNITMLNGMTYELRRSGPVVRLKNTPQEQSRMVFADFIALDGYVHIMDTVLTPTAVSNSIYDHAMQTEDFSLLVENIDFVQLTDIVDRDLPLTWLAPNNAAYRRVIFNTLETGEILKRHLFRGLLFCDVIANQTSIKAVNDVVLDVELRGIGPWGLEGQHIYVGGAHIYECDILAGNGVFHAIDRVIGVDFETVEPSVSPGPTSTMSPTFGSPTLSPTAATVTEIERTLNQTLYGISNLTSEDIGEWEIVANYQANQYLANRTQLSIEAVLKFVAFYVNEAVANERLRVLQPAGGDSSDEWVTIDYTHTLRVRQVGGASNFDSVLNNIDELFLEPFNNVDNKAAFQALLADRGEFLSDVTSVSNVISLQDSQPSPVPSRRPTITSAPVAIPTKAPTTGAPKKSEAYPKMFVWTWVSTVSVTLIVVSFL